MTIRATRGITHNDNPTALPPGRAHPRDKLATLLRGDMRQPQARASLRQALAALRRALAASDTLRVDRETVALDPDAVSVDTQARAAQIFADLGIARWRREADPVSTKSPTDPAGLQ